MWKLGQVLSVLAVLIVSCELAPPMDTTKSEKAPFNCGLLNHKLLKSLSDSCTEFRNHELPEVLTDETRLQVLCYIYESNLNNSCNSSQSDTLKLSEQNEVDLEKSLLESAESVCKNITLVPVGNTYLKQLIKTDMICQRICLDYQMKAEKLCSVSYFLKTFYDNPDNKQKSVKEPLPNIQNKPLNSQELKPKNVAEKLDDNGQLDASNDKKKDVNEQTLHGNDFPLGDAQIKVSQSAAAIVPRKDSNVETQGLEKVADINKNLDDTAPSTNVKAQEPILRPTQTDTAPVPHPQDISAQESLKSKAAPQPHISQETSKPKAPETNVKPPEQSKLSSEQKPETPKKNNEKLLDNVETSTQSKTSSNQLPANVPQDDSERKYVLPNGKNTAAEEEKPKENVSSGKKPAAATPEAIANIDIEDEDAIEQNVEQQDINIDRNDYDDDTGEQPYPSAKETKEERTKPSRTNAGSDGFPNNLDNIDSESNFFFYFMMLCIVTVLVYVAYHNKQKIQALMVEGPRRRGYRGRRPNSANYHKLDSNLEEAISSSCKKNSSHIIY